MDGYVKDHACDDDENSGSDQMICKNPNTAEEEVITSIVLSKSPAIGPKPIVPKKPDVPLKPKIIGPKPTNLYLSKDSHSNPIYHEEAEKEVSPKVVEGLSQEDGSTLEESSCNEYLKDHFPVKSTDENCDASLSQKVEDKNSTKAYNFQGINAGANVVQQIYFMSEADHIVDETKNLNEEISLNCLPVEKNDTKIVNRELLIKMLDASKGLTTDAQLSNQEGSSTDKNFTSGEDISCDQEIHELPSTRGIEEGCGNRAQVSKALPKPKRPPPLPPDSQVQNAASKYSSAFTQKTRTDNTSHGNEYSVPDIHSRKLKQNLLGLSNGETAYKVVKKSNLILDDVNHYNNVFKETGKKVMKEKENKQLVKEATHYENKVKLDNVGEKPHSYLKKLDGSDSSNDKIKDKADGGYRIPFVKRRNKANDKHFKGDRRSCPPLESLPDQKEKIEESLENKWKCKSFTSGPQAKNDSFDSEVLLPYSHKFDLSNCELFVAFWS